MSATLKIAMSALIGAVTATAANANETITYTYDALGRLTQVSHAGTVNPGLSSTYAYDPADNRTGVTVTGAPHALAVRAAKSATKRKANLSRSAPRRKR